MANMHRILSSLLQEGISATFAANVLPVQMMPPADRIPQQILVLQSQLAKKGRLTTT